MERAFRLSSQRRITALLAAIVIILVVVAILAFETTARMIGDREAVGHSHYVLAELQETQATVDDAEDQQRGYVITGDEQCLGRFERVLAGFGPKVELLKRLTADNPAQQELIGRLASIAGSSIDELRAPIETRRRQGPHEARDQIRAMHGRGPLDQIRKILDGMVSAERNLLDQRLISARSSDRRAMRLLSALLLSFVGCLAAFFAMIRESQKRQLRSATELRKSREQFELAVRGSKDGLWDWDIESGVVYFSPRWKSMLGYEEDEVEHHFREFESRLHADDHDRVLKTVEDYLEGRLPVYSVEFRMRTKEGPHRWILARGAALRDDSGKPFRMAGSHTDITDRKETETQLAAQNELLERAMKAERETNAALKRAQALMVQNEKMAGLGNMVAGVAHEINNPLAFITNNVAVLRRDFDEICQLVRLYEAAGSVVAREAPELERQICALRDRVEMPETLASLPGLLARTAEGLKRISQIVNDLRLFARLDEGEVNEADLDAGIRSTATIIQGHAKDKEVSLQLELEPLPRVTCNAARVNQVVMNLLSNAIDACPPGGTVTVRTGLEDHHARIDVIDDGHGISPAIRDRIFDPFFTTKPIGKGTGLGLSISYGIVQDHGGTIEVDSTPGHGSRFTVRLPFQQAGKRKKESLVGA
jgi:PAS domain S-box-containing protein